MLAFRGGTDLASRENKLAQIMILISKYLKNHFHTKMYVKMENSFLVIFFDVSKYFINFDWNYESGTNKLRVSEYGAERC